MTTTALDFLNGFIRLLIYFIICAASALALRKATRVPVELFRKILHLILLGSIFIFLYAYETWWISALSAAGFAVIVYPILSFAERIPGYSRLLTERKEGEIKKSLLVVFFMFTALICVCWGLLDKKYFALASILGWGVGDGVAALAGKRFGKHYLEGAMIEGRKTVEGSAAMFASSFLTICAVLSSHNAAPASMIIPVAALTSAVNAVVELYTRNGMDTITCPFASATVMIPLIYLLGAM